ncbi:Cysteine desulfurase [uncultured Gammaproteobacteria bacterium]
MIYLDYNASVPVKPAVRAAVIAALDVTGNPSSIHRAGRACRALMEDARERVGALVGVAPRQVIFTSGGTEANALALRAACGARMLVSAIEHDSVAVSAAAVGAGQIPVTAAGVIDLAALAVALARDPAPMLVSVMLVNNETGVIQPVAEAARLAHQRGALVHCDAVQAAGRVPLDLAALGVDLLSLSAHKLGGPKGVGALVVRDGALVVPLLTGGGQERRLRAGTENLSGIVGFGVAAQLAEEDLADVPRLAALRDLWERRALALRPAVRVIGAEAPQIIGAEAPRVANTSCVALPGVAAALQVMALDLAGIAVSAGAACSSGKVGPSRVLTAMGVEPGLASAAIRLSLGWASRHEDIEAFCAAWARLGEGQ